MSTERMTAMTKYTMTQHLTSYIYDIIDRNDYDIQEHLDEVDIQELCDHALEILERAAGKETDQDRIDFLFEGLLLYAIVTRAKDNAAQ